MLSRLSFFLLLFSPTPPQNKSNTKYIGIHWYKYWYRGDLRQFSKNIEGKKKKSGRDLQCDLKLEGIKVFNMNFQLLSIFKSKIGCFVVVYLCDKILGISHISLGNRRVPPSPPPKKSLPSGLNGIWAAACLPLHEI